MDRRSALRAIGVSAGSFTVGTPYVSFETVAKKEASTIVEAPRKFLELSIEVTDTDSDARAVVGCRQYPSFTIGNGRIYLSHYGRERADLPNDEVIWATHNGILGTQSQDELPLESVPHQANSYGSAQFSVKKRLPTVRANVEEQSAEIHVGNKTIGIQRNQEARKSGRIKIADSDKDSKLVTADIYVAYHGIRNLVGHTNQLLFPNNPGINDAMQTLKGQARSDRNSNEPSIKITEYESIDGYTIENGNPNGAN